MGVGGGPNKVLINHAITKLNFVLDKVDWTHIDKVWTTPLVHTGCSAADMNMISQSRKQELAPIPLAVGMRRKTEPVGDREKNAQKRDWGEAAATEPGDLKPDPGAYLSPPCGNPSGHKKRVEMAKVGRMQEPGDGTERVHSGVRTAHAAWPHLSTCTILAWAQLPIVKKVSELSFP